MAGTEQGSRHEPRRFITRHDVEDAAAASGSIRLRGRDVLTDEAAQRAVDLGVSIERDQANRPAVAPDADLRRAVRAAVIAELGSEAANLDLVIDRVMTSRSGQP